MRKASWAEARLMEAARRRAAIRYLNIFINIMGHQYLGIKLIQRSLLNNS